MPRCVNFQLPLLLQHPLNILLPDFIEDFPLLLLIVKLLQNRPNTSHVDLLSHGFLFYELLVYLWGPHYHRFGFMFLNNGVTLLGIDLSLSAIIVELIIN